MWQYWRNININPLSTCHLLQFIVNLKLFGYELHMQDLEGPLPLKMWDKSGPTLFPGVFHSSNINPPDKQLKIRLLGSHQNI